MKNKIVVSFSGGKDSTLALHRLVQSGEWDINSLLTTITEDFKRTSIHGVRETLLDKQAEVLGIPLRKVYIPKVCSNEKYEKIMSAVIEEMVENGVTHMMFGDIHLQDVKKYRENMMGKTPIKPVFPIWGEESHQLIEEFLTSGFQTVVTCLDSQQLDHSFVGRVINRTFLEELPKSVDPCGENGEFHTFVFNGPLFQKPIQFTVSKEKTITKDVFTNENRFYFVDLLPSQE
ncbi:uncharacterized protein (TIGR00290 family) [Salirhabdus euzebyi]|uniref:Uncharacterized protein (TIGR00290 family) n=1 Tax=Salirhabdus euzebyi TaxID=394506 RepID=A0A841Q4D5_9BACI|nr:diphthine--ammonia ligase [Salirhabdus euzebyi]MBB6453255.1 uncharacterized protein (TIGR00290 family) [Salirhabdus euzebyi]